MKEDPIQYAQRTLSKTIDQVEEINNIVEETNNIIIHLKDIIKEYFSDHLEMDETPVGAMRRNQIRKELLDFANK